MANRISNVSIESSVSLSDLHEIGFAFRGGGHEFIPGVIERSNFVIYVRLSVREGGQKTRRFVSEMYFESIELINGTDRQKDRDRHTESQRERKPEGKTEIRKDRN